MVGGEGRGRAVGGDGAMAMGCWLRGRSAWEDEGVMIADNSWRNKSGHDTISSSDHAWSTTLTQKETDRDRGKCGIRGIRGIRGHHAGSGGATRGPGRGGPGFYFASIDFVAVKVSRFLFCFDRFCCC